MYTLMHQHTHIFNLFCQPVTLPTVWWQLVADRELTRLMELCWPGLQSCRFACACVAGCSVCVPVWENIFWLKIRVQERRRAMSLGCRAMWKRENDMLMNAYCMNKRAEWVCVWIWWKSCVGVHQCVFLSMCTWINSLLQSLMIFSVTLLPLWL